MSSTDTAPEAAAVTAASTNVRAPSTTPTEMLAYVDPVVAAVAPLTLTLDAASTATILIALSSAENAPPETAKVEPAMEFA